MNEMTFTNDLSVELFSHIISDKGFIDDVRKVFGLESAVVLEAGGKKKVFGFIGMGCGITYLTYDKRSRKAKALDDIVREVRRNVNTHLSNVIFSKEEHEYFENLGCPVLAVLQQDQQIQIAFYSRVVEYAQNVLGIQKIDYYSTLD